MIILGIETSCDETALSLVESSGNLEHPKFKVLSTSLFSQTKLHEIHGGVVPMLAKREHQKNLIPLLKNLLEKANFSNPKSETQNSKQIEEIKKILEREQELALLFIEYIPTIEKPNVDAIAVTYGPGLEPALWVGVSFAKALSYIWNIPIIPVNHMEGHIVSPLFTAGTKIEFPALALLISGGHTELVLTEKWGEYKVIGKTRDDAVGEAFDKVARLLGLPYPGGPQISILAEKQRQSGIASTLALPRPMINSNDYDFSFSGLKTSVLYKLKEIGKPSEKNKEEIAREFEDAVTEVLVAKTKQAIEEFGPQSLIIAGGVSANSHIRKSFEKLAEEFPQTKLLIPGKELSTDNAIMIAGAGYINFLLKKESNSLKAEGNLQLG
ncbi:MAG: tRNA (adenosine(37)-N6)-threonylcarbamoyltransferase complex transferase subunit TsaD [Candidatus Pacebacteria bacterium]|nr:tRNA (adenosine(37)-N6)-threonylcarbamoyltransferase complex transferase subunit TsaD [Candidatus Paceibacterota bacterium]